MNKAEILKQIETKVRGGSRYSGTDPEQIELEGATFEIEEEEGGEGQGDSIHYVLNVTDGTTSMFVMVAGNYESNNGSDWSYASVFEVTPYQKSVRDWAEVKNQANEST